jgi:hypothetical protein
MNAPLVACNVHMHYNNSDIRYLLIEIYVFCRQEAQICKLRGFHGSDYEDAVFRDVTPCGSFKN